MSLRMFLALFLGLSTESVYEICACESSQPMTLRLDAAVSKGSTFFLLPYYTPEKFCKRGDELEEVMEWRNIIQFSEGIPDLFLMLYCSDLKVQHLPETEGMNVFRKVKHSWFQMRWIKWLKTEAWICLSISLPWLKTKGWFEHLRINYEWIFLLAYANSQLPKQHYQAILALTK